MCAATAFQSCTLVMAEVSWDTGLLQQVMGFPVKMRSSSICSKMS